jgi:hypothetical protein
MKLKDITKLLSKSQGIMVCEWDSFSLTAAVVMKFGKTVQTLAQAESNHTDPASAFVEVLQSLRTQGWQGNQLVVLTPSVMTALIELPVSPAKPKPLSQMQELVRWEAEPLLMQHQLQWSLGQLMEARGLLTPEQVQEINQEQKLQNQAGAKPDRKSLKRFGELAVAHGYVSAEQATPLFDVQDWLRGEDDDIECGWTAHGEVEDVPGVWHWQVCATHRSIVMKWQELCHENELELLGLFPLSGNSLALVDAVDKNTVVLEASRLLTSTLHLKKQQLVQVHHYLNRGMEMLHACLEGYHSIQAGKQPNVYLSAPVDKADSLSEELSVALGLTVSPIMKKRGDVLSANKLAVAGHLFGLKGGKRTVMVRPGGPLPPVFNRLETQAGVLVLILFMLIASSEVILAIQHNAITSEKAEIDARAKVLDEAVARIKKQRDEIDRRKAELEQQKQDQRRMESRLSFFGVELTDRAVLVQAILGILQNNINEQIIVHRIDEMGRRVGVQPPVAPLNMPGVIEADNFNIDAWALSEAAAQEFVQNMKLAVAPWSMEVRDIQVMEMPGPMNLDGYSVSLSLVRVMPEQGIES